MPSKKQMEEAFEIGKLSQLLMDQIHDTTGNRTVQYKAITLSFIAVCMTEGLSVDDMCDLIRSVAGQVDRGMKIKETEQ